VHEKFKNASVPGCTEGRSEKGKSWRVGRKVEGDSAVQQNDRIRGSHVNGSKKLKVSKDSIIGSLKPRKGRGKGHNL